MEKKKKIFSEFKDFIMRGNVLDLAIGVILATAFGKITSSLVNDMFMPFFGLIVGSYDLTKLNILLREAFVRSDGTEVPALTLGIGVFISTIIDFLLIALFVFLLVKGFNKARALVEAKMHAEAAATPIAATSEELLADILAELRKNSAVPAVSGANPERSEEQ